MKTSVKKIRGFFKVTFKQGNQLFTLDADCETIDEAEYYKSNLDNAFKNFKEELTSPEPLDLRSELMDFILEIDFLTTTEFCEKYKVPLPIFTGEVKSSADQFLQIDAIKHRMFVEKAKELNRKYLSQREVKAEANTIEKGCPFDEPVPTPKEWNKAEVKEPVKQPKPSDQNIEKLEELFNMEQALDIPMQHRFHKTLTDEQISILTAAKGSYPANPEKQPSDQDIERAAKVNPRGITGDSYGYSET